jgi:hypothetical protein
MEATWVDGAGGGQAASTDKTRRDGAWMVNARCGSRQAEGSLLLVAADAVAGAKGAAADPSSGRRHVVCTRLTEPMPTLLAGHRQGQRPTRDVGGGRVVTELLLRRLPVFRPPSLATSMPMTSARKLPGERLAENGA